MYTDIEPFDPEWGTCDVPDYHAVVTIQLCELINAGFFDLTRSDWDFGPKYSDEQHTQLCEKITNHYYYREISLVPPGIWKHEFLRKMNEIMPKYMAWYKVVAEKAKDIGISYDYIVGDGNKQATDSHKLNNDEYYKSRNIFSDFPQTSLAGNNQDYASTGNDTEYERINEENKTGSQNESKDYKETRSHVRDPLEYTSEILLFDNVDATIIAEIEPLFSCMFTVNINGW